MDKQPIITVVVYSYNSSEYIVDTLESIRNQTYPQLMLIISDDCSTDNTVEICKKWICNNETRFIKTKLLTSDRNTGISANANRAWDACETEYFKDIAGDDILLPNCIQDYVDYIKDYPDAVVVFARIRPFYVESGIKVWSPESTHDYSFFDLTPQEQYDYLLHKGNHIPAVSCFYNITKLRDLGFRHDERIPLLEDHPKWLFLARNSVVFHFIEKHTVGYRCNENSLSIGIQSPQYFRSRLLFYLYCFQEEIKDKGDQDYVYNLMCDQVLYFYKRTYDAVTEIKESRAYRIGHFVLSPARFLLALYRKLSYFLRS